MRHESVERRMYRGVDDHRVTAVGDQTQHFDDAEHDVGNDGRAAHFQVVPLPTLASEFADGFGILRSIGISGVAVVDSSTEGIGHRRRKLHVHLRDPQRQDVGWVRTPLHARALASQLLER